MQPQLTSTMDIAYHTVMVSQQNDTQTEDSKPMESESQNVSTPNTTAQPLTRRRRVAKRTISVVPSMITLGNLLCGFFAIFWASRDPEIWKNLPLSWSPMTYAITFIFIGMILDGVDGRVARMTGQTSELGEQLDSFADMVTFGVAPAFAVVMLVRLDIPFLAEAKGDYLIDRAVLIAGGIYVSCAALRLARFNIEIASDAVDDHLTFKGLPSPGAAATVASLVLLHEHFLAPLMRTHTGDITHAINEPWTVWLTKLGVIAVMLLVAFAMVSKIKYVHLLNRYIRGQAPIHFIAICVVCVGFVAVVPQQTFAAIAVAYALSAPVTWLVYKILGKKEKCEALIVKDTDGENDSPQSKTNA
jgi:CDP-diacylglycerol---serine O-phosphatidyltransferase